MQARAAGERGEEGDSMGARMESRWMTELAVDSANTKPRAARCKGEEARSKRRGKGGGGGKRRDRKGDKRRER